MMRFDPTPVDVGDFVVDPDEPAPACPPGEKSRLPMQPALEFFVVREVDDG
jgi:hypothetical protein